MKLKMLHLAPLAPQIWGGPEFQSPPEYTFGTLREAGI
jgi:hypothetical protein